MRQVLKKAKFIAVFVLAISYLGCEEVTNLFPDVTSAFTYTINEQTGTVTFLNISEDADTYQWDFGDGDSSVEINPIKKYAASGTYTVTLKAMNVAGASDSSQDEVTVVINTGGGEGGGDCTEETSESLDATDFNLTFQTDPGSAIIEDGAAFSYIDNPDTDNEVNSSCKVGEIVRDASLPFANNQIVFDTKFDFTANSGFKLKVWAPAVGTNVLLKLEDKTDSGINTEVGAVTVSANAWEELTFDFPGTESGKYDKIVLFFDINTDSGATYYIDDFALYSDGNTGGSLEVCEGGELINDFETADNSIFNNFGGGVGTIIDNPDTSVNTSAKVAQYVKGAGEVFAGITIEVDPDIDFNAGVFSIDVSSQAVRQLLFKLEGLGIEQIIPTSGTGWETITYDFSSVGGNIGAVTAITLIMDNGTAGDGSGDWTIQFDNIRLCSNESTGGGNSLEACEGGELVNDFETADNSIFNNFGGGVGTIIDNPDTSVNTSAKVAQYVKGAGEVFAGITIEVDPDIDFNAGVFSIDVSSQAVRQLLFKLEGLGIEQIIPTSGTGWETITYDFSSVGGNIGAVTAITLIMDNGTAGDGSGDWTIQFDNIRLCSNESTGGGTAATFPLDFEDGVLFFNAFEGATVAVIDNPQPTGNPSSKVLELVKPAGVPFFAGINSDPAINGPVIDLSNGLVFTMKVWSPKPGISVRMRLEQEPGVTDPPAYEIFQTTGNANEWNTLTFDFSTTPAQSTYSYTRLVLNTDWGTDPAGGETFYIDDIEQGSGPPPPPGLELPIDFDDAGLTYDFVTFNGASYSVVDNPDLSGVNAVASKVGEIVNAGGAYEGGAFTLDTPVNFATDKDITLKFYSTVPVPVLLKFEGAGAPVETTANHGGTGWEQLTFSFTTSDQFGTLVLFVDGPGTTAGTFYMDDIEQVAGAGGGGGTGSNLAINGDFETGDLSGWTSFATENNGTFEVSTAQANGGLYSGLVIADVDGIGSPSFPVVKQANIGVGTVTPNTSVTITFDLYGSVAGAGGVVFAEFFSELSGGGVSKSEILGGGPLFPNGTWTTYSFTTTTGNDVSGGVTLQLKADCGGNSGCKIDAYFDNVTVTIN